MDRLVVSMSIGTASSKRIVQLDVLRGVAVLLVMAHHIVLQPDESGIFGPLENVMIRFGWSGVDLFFVLSGFLVGGLLLGELRSYQKLDVRRFIIRRGFKIWPSYFAYLAVVLLILLVQEHGNAHRALGHILPNFFHVQNYLGTARPHTWSLAVEEHFYVFLPLLMLLLLYRKKAPADAMAWLPVIGLALIVACTTMRYIVNADRPYDLATHYNPTHLRMDSLFFGVIIAYLYHFKGEFLAKIAAWRYSLLLGGIALVTPMTIVDIRDGWFVSVLGFTFLYVGYGLILIAVVYSTLNVGLLGKVIGSRLGKVIAFIGFFSYPIYLWHIELGRLPLQAFANRGLFMTLGPSWRWIVFSTMYLILAVGAGVVLGLLVERPALALRDMLFPARTAALDKTDLPLESNNLSPAITQEPGLIEAAQ